MGNARFTLPANDVPTRPVMALSTNGIGRNLFRATRQQANIVTTMPKFEVPKFEKHQLSGENGYGNKPGANGVQRSGQLRTRFSQLR